MFSFLPGSYFFKLVEEFVVVGNPFDDKADHPVPIDQEGCPAAAVGFSEPLVLVADERETEAMTLGEFPVGFKAVAADAQNLGVERFETFDVVLKRFEFVASDRCEVGVIERQHDRFLRKGSCQIDRSDGRIGMEKRSFLPDFESLGGEGSEKDRCRGQQSLCRFFHGLLPSSERCEDGTSFNDNRTAKSGGSLFGSCGLP